MFWQDSWVRGSPLSTRFARLHALECQKEATVADKALLEGETFSWQWSWRHERRGREAGELLELLQLLRQLPPLSSTDDGWIWSWVADDIFSTKILRSVLDNAASDLCQLKTV